MSKTTDILTAHSDDGTGLVEVTQYGLSLPDDTQKWGDPANSSYVVVPGLVCSNDRSNSRTGYYLDPSHRGAYNLALLRKSYTTLRAEAGMSVNQSDEQAGLILLTRKILIVTTEAREVTQ